MLGGFVLRSSATDSSRSQMTSHTWFEAPNTSVGHDTLMRDTRGIYVAGADDLAWILQRTATHVAVRCNNSLQHGIHVTETDDLTRMLNGSATHAAAHCNSPQQCRIHVVAG